MDSRSNSPEGKKPKRELSSSPSPEGKKPTYDSARIAASRSKREGVDSLGERPDTSPQQGDNQPLDASSIRQLPTKELNQILIACDKNIKQLKKQARKNTSEIMQADSARAYQEEIEPMKEKREEIGRKIKQEEEQKKLCMEVLKEKDQGDELLSRGDRSGYDKQRRIDLYEQHELEKTMMEGSHKFERDKALQESRENGSFQHSSYDVRAYPAIAKEAEAFLNSRFPEMVQQHEQKKQEQKKEHLDKERAFEEEIRSLYGL